MLTVVSLLGAALSGCQKVGHDNLGYAPAGSVSFTQVTDLGKNSEDGLNVFDIELSSSDAKLFLKFYGTDFYLSNASFTPCDAPEKAHYSRTDSYFEKGGQRLSIEKGAVTVASTGSDYTFSGVLWLSDGEKVRISARGELVYERLVFTYTQAFPPTVTAVEGGGYNIQLILGTDGIEQKNMGAWMEYPGTGQYMVLELISATEDLKAGVYTVAEDTSYGVGNYLAGYGVEVDLSDYGMGIVISHRHSRIMDVVDGQEILNAYLTAGKVTVKESESGFDIEVDADKQYALFSGAIGGSDEPDPEPDPVPEALSFTEEVSDVYYFDFASFSFVKAEGVEKHTMVLSRSGSVVAQLAVITAEGGSILDHPGGYVSSASSTAAGTFYPDWDGSMLGYSAHEGSYVVVEGKEWLLTEEGKTLYISSADGETYNFYAGVVNATNGNATKAVSVVYQATKEK